LSLEVIKQKVENSLKKLRRNDWFLIHADTNERTISHKLAEYLQEEFPYPNWNVDCEYNRHFMDIKKVAVPAKPDVGWDDIEAKTVYPDIIVHRRNSDDANLLVIEVKKSSNQSGHQFDIHKLAAFTKDEYRYRFGLFLILSMNGTFDILVWHSNGEKIDEEQIPLETN